MKELTIFLLGDSISLHYGPDLQAALAGKYRFVRKEGQAEAMQNLDIPIGGNGGDSSRVLDYLLQREAAGHLREDLLLLNCGLHDVKRDPVHGTLQVPLDKYKQNLEQIVQVLRRAGVPVLWIRTTPVDDQRHNSLSHEFHRYNRDVELYNEAADQIMNASGIPLVDLNSFSRNLGGDAYCDHVHYTESARARQAAFLAGAVSFCLQEKLELNH
ncbi:MAG: Lipolytic protein family [Paenibacillaceae bacterium]|nr:Lipolytic protein family [Paenibacillaceae bacterium]